jgi:hypothetical protein
MKGLATMNARRIEHAGGRVTYYLHTEDGYGDTMEVTPKDLMSLGAWLLEHEQGVVEDALNNDVLNAEGGYWRLEGDATDGAGQS